MEVVVLRLVGGYQMKDSEIGEFDVHDIIYYSVPFKASNHHDNGNYKKRHTCDGVVRLNLYHSIILEIDW